LQTFNFAVQIARKQTSVTGWCRGHAGPCIRLYSKVDKLSACQADRSMRAALTMRARLRNVIYPPPTSNCERGIAPKAEVLREDNVHRVHRRHIGSLRRGQRPRCALTRQQKNDHGLGLRGRTVTTDQLKSLVARHAAEVFERRSLED